MDCTVVENREEFTLPWNEAMKFAADVVVIPYEIAPYPFGYTPTAIAKLTDAVLAYARAVEKF